MKKIEQLIEKREDKWWKDKGDGHKILKEIVKDLKSLQEPTEERECENCKKLQKELDGISFSM